MAKVNGNPMNKPYRYGYNLKRPVEDLLSASGVDLTNGGGFKELEQFQNYLSGYKFILYDGLSPDRFIFSRNSLSNKKLYLLYDGGLFNVFTNLKADMAKMYLYNAYDTLYDNTHKCDKVCCLCTATPPFFIVRSKHFAACNR